MEAFILALLANVAFRTAIEDIAVKLLADIFHRRATDPAFMASSDAAFSALSAAKTDVEVSDAQVKLRALMSGS